uniref:U-scoloptoxin(17)-Er2a n=1 Tax=Ethmostigmus rubripes TaxID=62613 RepID=TXH2A_ETHRU|nr:RecName: Full=U-scoloptoxin(17)-Er2a; Short=U-SLPTX(17)-Er2a; Flags: Precursor [Ethmostigmus rubripes]
MKSFFVVFAIVFQATLVALSLAADADDGQCINTTAVVEYFNPFIQECCPNEEPPSRDCVTCGLKGAGLVVTEDGKEMFDFDKYRRKLRGRIIRNERLIYRSLRECCRRRLCEAEPTFTCFHDKVKEQCPGDRTTSLLRSPLKDLPLRSPSC